MLRYWVSALILICFISPSVEAAEGSFISFSYHDIRDDLVDDLDPDRVAVSTRNLIAQFSWLREHGYHPVSLDDILSAHEGKSQLPEKAVLLTFDDGFASVYTKVFPLLKLFDYPAVIAVVGKWLEAGPGEKVKYENRYVNRDHFLTWGHIREMVQSGLVEVASHSYDLHRAVVGNPQGNVQPVAVTRQYNTETKKYEDHASHKVLLKKDMRKMVSLIKNRAGVKPRCMVWPYGLYNSMAMEQARQADMPISLILGECINRVDDLSKICRLLVQKNPPLKDFVWELRNFYKTQDPIRVAHVDLDYVYDADKVQQKRNLDKLLDRIKTMKINTVYLQAFSDSDGNGASEAMYFPNRHMPMRDDLFNRVAWQLRTRAGVNVYAWMPTFAFELEDKVLTQKLLVQKWENEEAVPSKKWYPRLSPFHPEARRIIGEIYEDLAAGAFFTGLLFHDDAYLSDFEDAGTYAMQIYRTDWGIQGDIDLIKSDAQLFKRWSRMKTEALAEFTDELTERVRRFRPEIKTARNMYAIAVLNPNAEEWIAQSMEVFLKHYDYTALMAMPYMEGAEDPEKWLENIVKTVAGYKHGLAKSVFELQSVRWDRDEKLPASLLAEQMELLQRMGAVNFGYYPDDFIADHPKLEEIKKGISLETYPYKK